MNKSFSFDWFTFVVIGVILLIIITIGMSVYSAYGTQETISITVTDKERICNNTSEGVSCKYLVFTDAEVFENTDTVLNTKFNSSDIQGQLIEGNKYTVTVVGWRIPIFSMYRNIIEVENGH